KEGGPSCSLATSHLQQISASLLTLIPDAANFLQTAHHDGMLSETFSSRSKNISSTRHCKPRSLKSGMSTQSHSRLHPKANIPHRPVPQQHTPQPHPPLSKRSFKSPSTRRSNPKSRSIVACVVAKIRCEFPSGKRRLHFDGSMRWSDLWMMDVD